MPQNSRRVLEKNKRPPRMIDMKPQRSHFCTPASKSVGGVRLKPRRVSFGGGVEKWGGPGRKGGGGEGKPSPLRGFNTRRGSANYIHIRSAHAADPVYSLRQNPLRQLNFETPFPRFYRAQKTGGTDGACAPFGGRRARCARARAGARCARAAWGGWARGALWGYSEAIPNGKLFRSHFEW